ncbi:hypothetical protein RhiirB3_444446 [Rhizophagus irregularis]|nr:hypothetical protein RhiirB3_444446 [Rhizophagus irregularis]
MYDIYISTRYVYDMSTLDLFEFLNPHLILSGRKVLSNRILNNETESIDKLQNEKLSNDQIDVTLAFDRWKNVLNQHIFGSLFITSSGEILIWKASDISSEKERMIEIIPKIEDLIKDAGVDLGAKVIAIISDSAAAYAGAHDDFESLTLKSASAKVITVAAYFKNGNNSYFIGKLRDIQKELYNKYYSIMVPCETRWNSHFYCFKSLIRSKQALRNLAIRHERSQSTPAEASTSTSNNTNKIYLNKDICKILLDNDWWNTIESLQEVLLPYCGVLNKLQSDKARLFELLHALGYFIQFWNQFPNIELGEKMIE